VKWDFKMPVNQNTTLLDYLTIRNPEVSSDASWKGGNTKTKESVHFEISYEPGDWSDFSYKKLRSNYRKALSRVI
jgi:hypothetical protein